MDALMTICMTSWLHSMLWLLHAALALATCFHAQPSVRHVAEGQNGVPIQTLASQELHQVQTVVGASSCSKSRKMGRPLLQRALAALRADSAAAPCKGVHLHELVLPPPCRRRRAIAVAQLLPLAVRGKEHAPT